jgi:hypothetical protein
LSYLEAGISAGGLRGYARQLRRRLYLDTVAIIAGEIFGWPKKDAEITFTEDGDLVSGQVIAMASC